MPATKRAVTPRPTAAKPSVWDKIIALGKTIPEGELKNWPRDGGKNFDHYLDGSPKQYPATDGYTESTMSVRKPAAKKPAARKPATKPKRALKPRTQAQRSVWDKIIALGKRIPEEELKNFPTDGARNLEHYLYGTPKQG